MIAAYTYDGAGNIDTAFITNRLQVEAPVNCKYNELNQLVEYTSPDGVKTTYTYYPNGLRKTKTTDGKTTTYYYDGQNVIIEAENGSLKYRNTYGMNQISRQDAVGNTNYFMYNGHGDVVKTVDSSGNIMNSYEYDIYGKVISFIETGIPNPMRYAGQMYDNESGLYYLRARYYDPRVGRFISEDTNKGDINNPGSLNLYTYCWGNPIRYIDWTGHDSAVATYWMTHDMNSVNPGEAIKEVANVLFLDDAQTVISPESSLGKRVYAGFCLLPFGKGGKITKEVAEEVAEGIVKKGVNKIVQSLGSKTEGYLAKRGWTMDTMNEVVGNSYTTREAFNKATGNAATAYYNKAGDYVVVDNVTGELVQTSKFGDTGWIPDATIKNPYKP